MITMMNDNINKNYIYEMILNWSEKTREFIKYKSSCIKYSNVDDIDNLKIDVNFDEKYYKMADEFRKLESDLNLKIIQALKSENLEITNRWSYVDDFDNEEVVYKADTSIGTLSMLTPNIIYDLNDLQINLNVYIDKQKYTFYLNTNLKNKKYIISKFFELEILEREIIEYKLNYINKSNWGGIDENC